MRTHTANIVLTMWCALNILVTGTPRTLAPAHEYTSITAPDNITLIGVGVSRATEDSSWALIKNPLSGEDEIFELHDKIFGIGKLTAVTADGVEIERPHGDVLRLGLNGQSTLMNNFSESNEEVQTLAAVRATELGHFFTSGFQNMAPLVGKSHEEEQEIEGEMTSGVRYDSIPPTSLLGKLGVQPGDFVYSINDREVLYTREIYDAHNYAPTGENNSIALHVVRDGKLIELRTVVK
jgi:hypothetical protein